MSDEQLVSYFDAGFDRRQGDAETRFAEMVEAVRAGYGFAHDQKAYTRWRASVDRAHGTAKGLKQLLTDLGGNVERGGLEFQN